MDSMSCISPLWTLFRRTNTIIICSCERWCQSRSSAWSSKQSREPQAHNSRSAGVVHFFLPILSMLMRRDCLQRINWPLCSLSLLLVVDRLDDVELAGVCSGSGSLCGFIWRFTTNTHTRRTVEPDRPAGVSLPHTHTQTHTYTHIHKGDMLPKKGGQQFLNCSAVYYFLLEGVFFILNPETHFENAHYEQYLYQY